MPTLGIETFAGELSLHGGGGAFISASYIAALGVPSYLLSNLPAEPFGHVVAAEALQNNVDLSLSTTSTQGAPQITVAIVHDNDRAFLTHQHADALPSRFADSVAQAASKLAHLHIGELTTLIAYPQLITLASEHSLSISADCAWDESQFSNPDELAHLIAQLDVFLPSENEMQRLRSYGIDEHVAKLTVVKQGAKGAYACVADREQARVDASAVSSEVVDTIGAGDAFNSGFIAAWLKSSSVQEALNVANACGSIAVAKRGGATDIPPIGHLMEM